MKVVKLREVTGGEVATIMLEGGEVVRDSEGEQYQVVSVIDQNPAENKIIAGTIVVAKRRAINWAEMKFSSWQFSYQGAVFFLTVE